MEDFSEGEFRQGFIDEASEHLSSITRILLRMEQGDLTDLDREELLSELFRSFHTLKGLCGMAGLKDCARLSHALETVLQNLREGKLNANLMVLDQLLAGTRTLMAVVETVRNPELPMPKIDTDLELLAGLTAPAEPHSSGHPRPEAGMPVAGPAFLRGLDAYPGLQKVLTELDQRKILSAAQAGQTFTVLVFTPSSERAGRGENVDRLRQQIQETGTLIKAVPVMADGNIVFQFLAASPHAFESERIIADEMVPLSVQLSGERHRVVAGAVQPVVRVDLARLDDLMRYVGDLISQRSRLAELLPSLEGAPQAARRELKQLDQQMNSTLRDLRRAVWRARMVPLAETFNAMPLVVRDLARASQKEVNLVISGEMTEVDKRVVERLLDPLIHLVRNAIYHGIETPEERQAAGKPLAGTLALRGQPAGDNILVEVSDDGRGVDLQRVARKAQDLGWIEPDATLTPEQALNLIIRPGFSTQEGSDLSAGRGVGLDVVNRAVRSFGGRLSMTTTPGQGSSFRIYLPLTLVIQDVLLVRAGGERYAVPREMVERIVEIDPAQIVRIESGELLPWMEGYAVLSRLTDFANGRLASARGAGAAPTTASGQLFGLLGRQEVGIVAPHNITQPHENGRAVLVVDTVEAMREVVVHALADPLVAQNGISGATILSDGQVVLIIDLPFLFQWERSLERQAR